MPNPPDSDLFATLAHRLPCILSKLQAIHPESLARQSGFLKRCPRKIPISAFLTGLLAVASETNLSLEHIANVIGLAADTTYSKQALSQRLSQDIESFLSLVIAAWFGQLDTPVRTSRASGSFQRVLVQDSTTESLPKHLAKLFPGSGNQYGQDYASLKIQWTCDLKSGAAEQVSLSGFTRNDQAAAPDILKVARPGDLILRDLGYLVTAVLARLVEQHIFFLTRHRHGVGFYDAESGQPLDLPQWLKAQQTLDGQVLVGPERVPVRLVALPVPEEVANLRRHRAKASAQRRHRSPPGREHLFLMGWNLFLTNVPASTWPPKVLVAVYRLRWRIEIIFKTWKSHLGLRQLNCRTPTLLQLSVLTKLLFCATVCQFCEALELCCVNGQHVSLLRLAHILGQFACWFAAAVLGISVSQWLEFCLARHARYEQRKDRENYDEQLSRLRSR